MKYPKFLIVLFVFTTFLSTAHAVNYSVSTRMTGSLASGGSVTKTISFNYSGTLNITCTIDPSTATFFAVIYDSGCVLASQTASGSLLTISSLEVMAGETYSFYMCCPNSSTGSCSYDATFYLSYFVNEDPVISSITASPDSPEYGNPITVSAAATDPDDNLSYVRFYRGSTYSDDTSSPYQLTYNGLNAGSYTVTAYAFDEEGASDNDSVSFTITSRPISVNALSGYSRYGESPSNPGLKLVSGSLAYGETLAGIGLSNSFGITSTTAIGSYTLSVSGSPGNYSVTKTSGKWIVLGANYSLDNDFDDDGFDDYMESFLYGNLTTLTRSSSTGNFDGDLYGLMVEAIGGLSEGSYTSGTSWATSSAPGSYLSGLTLISPTGACFSVDTGDLSIIRVPLCP